MKTFLKNFLTVMLMILVSAVMPSCSDKDDEPEVNPGGGNKVYKAVFTIGDKNIEPRLDAEDADRNNVWIDLNNNGKMEEGEKVTEFVTWNKSYPVESSVVTIYGNLTVLGIEEEGLTSLDISQLPNLCDFVSFAENSLKSLDVSNNKKLTQLRVYCNQINEANMTKLIASMPTVKEKRGQFIPIKSNDSNEKNVLTKAHVRAANAKNWDVLDMGKGILTEDDLSK